MVKRVNYLNNKDLLAEIHKSKNSYCSYVSEDDSQYDYIVTDVKKINNSAVAQARKLKAKRLTQEAWEAAKATGNKRQKMSDFTVSARKIDKTDLVFRVMTFEHVPTDGDRKKNPKSRADHHSKVNFPPFQHYRLDKTRSTGVRGQKPLGGRHGERTLLCGPRPDDQQAGTDVHETV